MAPDLSLAEAGELLGREVVSCAPRTGGENSLVYQVQLAGQAEPLYHALELWDWFAQVGHPEALAGLADDMRGVLTHRPGDEHSMAN